MKHVDDWACWSLLILAMVLSPVALILAVPIAIGFGLDIFELSSEPMIALVLCAPFGLGLVYRLCVAASPRRVVAGLWSRLHLEQAAHLIHAP
jgi:hypothetical protein